MALIVTEMDRQQMAKHHHFHQNFFSNMLAVGTHYQRKIWFLFQWIGNETNFQSGPLAKIYIKKKQSIKFVHKNFLISVRPHKQAHAQFYNIFTPQFVMITVTVGKKKKKAHQLQNNTKVCCEFKYIIRCS